MSTDPRPSTLRAVRRTSLTHLVESKLLPALGERKLPFREYRRSRRAGSLLQAAVAPSPWTQQHRHGLVGTAFDYLAGAAWAKQWLTGATTRAWLGCQHVIPGSAALFPILDELLTLGPTRRRRDGTLRRHRDFYRGLVLLASLDAIYRHRGTPPPAWVMADAPTKMPELRRALREHYPTEVVTELRALLDCAKRDLPRPVTKAVYNPEFGLRIEDVFVDADGDLLIDDLLIELKVSVKPELELDAVVQLLGYAALDAARGNDRIKRIGVYNPRWRFLWTEDCETVVRLLGWTSFAEFRVWFASALKV
jgi:hypothetical protein